MLRRLAQSAIAAAAVVCLALSLAPAQQPRRDADGAPDSPSSAATRRSTDSKSKSSAGKANSASTAAAKGEPQPQGKHADGPIDYWSMLFVFALSTLIGLGVIGRVSRLLHTPLMSLTNAISAIAVVGAIIVCGSEYPGPIRFLGGVALFASMTNIVSGFLITDRMLKMFKAPNKARPAANASTKAVV